MDFIELEFSNHQEAFLIGSEVTGVSSRRVSVQTHVRATTPDSRETDLTRISNALILAAGMVERTDRSAVDLYCKIDGDPVTSLDREINQLVRKTLSTGAEGWLSEENPDDFERLRYRRVWIVDPIDGTREFVEGVPEWCISIGLVEGDKAVAGGILNPCTGEMFLGSLETGLQVRSLSNQVRESKDGAQVLVSRREYREGKWRSFEGGPLTISPVGSIAYRLALVAAGYASATCTYEARNEWDVAAGVALVEAGGGTVLASSGRPIRFNKEVPRVDALFAFAKRCSPAVSGMFGTIRPA